VRVNCNAPNLFLYVSVQKLCIFKYIYIYNCFYTKNNLKQIRESFVLKVIDRRRRNTNVSVCVCVGKKEGEKRESEKPLFLIYLFT
jgi:hypothetical protein